MTRSRRQAEAPPPAPFRHPVEVRALSRDAENRFRLAPDAEARARIADFLGLEALERLTLTVNVAPSGAGWVAKGQLTAGVVQSCVVTLEPVRSAIDVPVRRIWQSEAGAGAGAGAAAGAEVELDEDDLDAPEPLTDRIDLGELAVEALALAIDPWPRAEGAELGDGRFAAPGLDALTDDEARPFAPLAVLRGGRDREGG